MLANVRLLLFASVLSCMIACSEQTSPVPVTEEASQATPIYDYAWQTRDEIVESFKWLFRNEVLPLDNPNHVDAFPIHEEVKEFIRSGATLQRNRTAKTEGDEVQTWHPDCPPENSCDCPTSSNVVIRIHCSECLQNFALCYNGVIICAETPDECLCPGSAEIEAAGGRIVVPCSACGGFDRLVCFPAGVSVCWSSGPLP